MVDNPQPVKSENMFMQISFPCWCPNRIKKQSLFSTQGSVLSNSHLMSTPQTSVQSSTKHFPKLTRPTTINDQSGMQRSRNLQKQTYKNAVWYLVVLGICWLPDKVTLILNLTHLLNLDAELCY